MIRYALFSIFMLGSLFANTIIYNAKIYTLNDKRPWASSVVFESDKIVYVGDDKKAMGFKRASSKMVNADQKFIMPGIIDAHTHTAIAVLLETLGVSLKGTRGKKDILSRLRAYKKAYPDKKFYTGVGFYPYAFGPNGPSKEILDEIFPDSLAFFISNNGHQAWVNSKTLRYLGITKETKDPLPNVHYYYRDKEGNPTGFLIEGEAFWPHFKKMGIATTEKFYAILKKFLPQLSKQGITTLFDAGIPAVEDQALLALQALQKADKLPLRYMASHVAMNAGEAKRAIEDIKKLQTKFNAKGLEVSAVKFINDNSDDDNFGIVFKEAELSGYLNRLAEANIDVMIHTSQDRSTHQALNAIALAKKNFPKTKSRMTLSHVNMVRDTDFKRFSELKVIANIQTFDAVGGGYYEYRYMLYDEKWAGKLARYKHFFESDVVVSASSDYPVCGATLDVCSPFYGIQIGLTRQKVNKGKNAELLSSKDERVSLKQMLEAYTINAAYQLHKEKEIGSLEMGKSADLIILDQNPFDVDVYDLHKVKVLETISQGKSVYRY